MQYSFGGTRTAAKPLGTGKRESENKANEVLKLRISILWSCLASHTTFTIENPRTSVLWHVKDLIDIVALSFVDECCFDMCAFNLVSPKGVEPKVWYKKPTKVIGIIEQPERLRNTCPKTHVHGSLARQEYFLLPGGARLLKSRHAGCYPLQFSRALVASLS
jgi:hypothetical protein